MNSGQLLMLLSAYAYTYKAIYDSRSVSSQYNAAYASSQHVRWSNHSANCGATVQSCLTGDCVNTMDSGRSRCCRAATDLNQHHLSNY